MRVLITGADGFVGGHLRDHLGERGDTVAGVDRARADVRDAEAMRRAVREATPDVVFHLAAQPHVAKSFQDPIGTFSVNVLGTVAVLEAVRAESPRARVVVASSAEVYGRARAEELPLVERSELRPATPYAASKVAQEVCAHQYRRSHGLDVVVVRSFNAVGPRQSTEFALPAFASQLARVAHGAEPVLRVGNLSAERDFTDVRDVARAYRLLAEKGAPGDTYNLCSGRAVAIHDALEVLIRASGLDVRIEIDPARMRPVDTPRLVGSYARLREAVGWEPEISLERTMEDLFKFELGRVVGSR
jgi:GDP-4-dehydro-6-deoxy-D-mannose reductase